MTQDWSAPFTLDCLSSGSGFCVHCNSSEDAVEFFRVLRDAGVRAIPGFTTSSGLVHPDAAGWRESCSCYRFAHDGTLCRRGTVDVYERCEYKELAKFTFYPGMSALPELDVVSSASLLF